MQVSVTISGFTRLFGNDLRAVVEAARVADAAGIHQLVIPDHVVVSNDVQKKEAIELHGVADAQIVITGAQLFYRWFDARPSRSREEFCRQVGLDPSSPFILYVGSSVFIAPEEVSFA